MNYLPETNFKGKDEKDRKGFIPWLRSRLGFGGRGAAGGANLGRASFGASSGMGGFGGLLAGKLGLIAMVAVVGAAIGTTLYMKNPAAVNTAAFSPNKSPDNYIPAILRQPQNQGSSLDMFRDTNKGAAGVSAYDADGYDKNGYDKNGYDRNGYDKDGYDKNGYDKDGYDRDGYDKTGYDRNGLDRNGLDRNAAQNPKQGNMAQEMMGKLSGGNSGGLGGGGLGGSSRFSNMGGFGNKFNSGATGGYGNLGSGFKAIPKFNPKNKVLAMKGSARPVFSNSKGKKSGVIGKGAYGQAKGVKDTQRTSYGDGADGSRSTQDKAWQGTTPSGVAAGGAGVAPGGTGGAGIVTSPSLDNGGGGGGGGNNNGGGGGGPGADCSGQYCSACNGAGCVPDVDPSTKKDASPWFGLPEQAMGLIALSILLSVIGSWLVRSAALAWLGWILCGLAVIAASAAVVIGYMLTQPPYEQVLLGSIYMGAGILAGVAAGAACAGLSLGLPATTTLVFAGAAGIVALIATMMGREVGLTTKSEPIEIADVTNPVHGALKAGGEFLTPLTPEQKEQQKKEQDEKNERDRIEYLRTHPPMGSNTLPVPGTGLNKDVDWSTIKILDKNEPETKPAAESPYFKSNLPPLTDEQLKELSTKYPAPDPNKQQFIQGHPVVNKQEPVVKKQFIPFEGYVETK